MLGKLRETIRGIDNPEQYFKNKLGKNSEDFLMLERLVEETNGRITLEKLKKYTKIENGKIEGIYWEENLDLRWTSLISLGKLKKVGGNLYLEEVLSLKDLGELEEVGGYLDLRWTGVKVQLEVIKKIETKELTVGGHIQFGGGIQGIEKILNNKEIPGSLNTFKKPNSLGELEKVWGNFNLFKASSLKDLGNLEMVLGDFNLKGTSLKLQLEAMRKIKNGKLVVEGNIHYDDYIKQYFTKDLKLYLEKFEEKYGTKVGEIEGEQQEQIRELLEYIKKVEIEDLSKEIVKILKEDIIEEEKKEKVCRLNEEYKVYIQKIDGYLDNKN